MTERDELEALRRLAELEAKEAASVSPASDSFIKNLPAAVGMGAHKMWRAATQPLGVYSQADLDEANRLDKPLENAPGGTTGRVLGTIAPAIASSVIPGANTAVGATLLGAGYGALTTEGGIKDRAIGAGAGAVGGAAGKYAGDLIGKGASAALSKLRAAGTEKQVANAGRDAAAVAAKGAGYVLPPADVNPSAINTLLGGLSGKIKTTQEASARNQGTTNELAKAAVGAPKGAPLSVDALKAVRSQAGQAYDAIATTGTVTPGPQYTAALDRIVGPYQAAAKSFPNSKPPAVLAEIESLRTGQFDAGSAVAKIRTLREAADAAYGSGDKAAGKALKDGAKALEDALEDHAANLGQPDLLKAFKEARQLIAKTYSVQAGLNDTTGDVAANALARQLQRGKPLTGELETIARAAQAFPKATQALKEPTGAVSPLDFAMAGTAGLSTGNPLAALTLAARPSVRSAILSKPYQAMVQPPSYAPSRLSELMLGGAQSPALTNALLAIGASQAPEVSRRGR